VGEVREKSGILQSFVAFSAHRVYWRLFLAMYLVVIDSSFEL